VNVVVLVLVAVLLVAGRHALGQYTGGKNAASTMPIDTIPATPTGMFATVAADNTLTSVTVFVLRPGTEIGGSIVSIPVNADSTYGSGPERISLQKAYATGGADGLVQALESTLSLTLDFTAVEDAAKASGVLLAAAPVSVDLPRTVVGTANGATEVVFNRGAISLTAPQAVQVLIAESDTVTEAARRPNLEAVWAGVAASIGAGKPAPALSPTVASFDDLVAHLFAGPVGSRGLTVAAFGADTPNPDNSDVDILDRAEEILVFASLAPSRMSAPAEGLTYRIVAPPGYEAKVKVAVFVLLYSGGNVTSIDLTSAKQATTKIYVYDEATKADTEALKASFPQFTYGTPTSRPQGIDVTIVLGQDFLDGTAPVAPPSTTSTTPADAGASGAVTTETEG
jgi:hypothetical protein